MKKFIAACMLLLCMQAQAQLTMTVQVPPTGVLLKPQIWNMVLVNSNTVAKNVQLSLVLTDATTHQPVLSATTQPFTLASGALQVQASALSLTYTYESLASVPDQDPNGFLGVGNYEACYTLEDLSAVHTLNTTVEDCINFTVEPLSPPLLLMPEDQAVLNVVSQFTWLPPTPLNIFSNLNYDCIVVEVQPGQTSSEAVQQNLPLVHNNGTDMFLNPSLNAAFDTGKLYAWQVIAKNGNDYAAPSEVWTFKLGSNVMKDSVEITNTTYLVFKNNDDSKGVYTVVNDTLNIKYHSLTKESAVIEFIDDYDNVVFQKQQDLEEGENFINIPLPSSFVEEEVYSFRFVFPDFVTTKMFFSKQ